MQAGMHDDELKGTNRAERCSAGSALPTRRSLQEAGCQERARQKREALERAGGVVI